MTISPQRFDDKLSAWKAEQAQPWMALRYRLEHHHIRQAVGDKPLQILDAGGGNGRNAIAFAREGHQVTLVDYSPQMLADARQHAAENGVLNRLSFHEAPLAQIPELFPEPTFDLILCHNVVQYVDDLASTLRAVCYPLRPDGLISLVTVNRHSELYKALFRELDLDKAEAQLDLQQVPTTLFGVPMWCYSERELYHALEAVACQPLARYGISCVCNWLPNEPKFDPAFMARLERLEQVLATKQPYASLARYVQILAHKA